ncbi:MAG TPA: MraY family glycosyltransferase [Bacilli bacterium]|nr:MraY family glycosyltransferase [Bacilli bacterium]
MRLEVNLLNILLIVGTTFLISYLFMFINKPLSRYLGAIDIPNEKRRIHKVPTPRMGALGIYISFLIGYMIFGVPSVQMNSILIASFFLIVTGMLDDIKPIPNKYKLIIQVIAALITMFYGGFLLKEIDAFGINIHFGWFSYLITLFFIVGAINCINFIDGMDGLAGGICAIYFLTVGIIATITGHFNGLDVLLCFVTLGATLGYLKHNFHPAKIFMGDGGSMFLGYIIAVIALIGYKNVTFGSLLVPIALLAIPILDTLLAIIRRLIKHKSPMTPDKGHLHFQIYKYNNSEVKTVLIIYAVDLLFAAITIFYVLDDSRIAIPIYAVLFILFIFLIVKTNILLSPKMKRRVIKRLFPRYYNRKIKSTKNKN